MATFSMKQRSATRLTRCRRSSASSFGSSQESTSSGDRLCIEHNYVDHYYDPTYRPGEHEHEIDGSPRKRRGPRGGVLTPFPERLYYMLGQAKAQGFEDIVSWQPHGRAFVVREPSRFVEEILPKFFKQSKLTSFQRQVNLYGFRRLTTGKDRGAYYNEWFLRGRPDLAKRLIRMRIKGTGTKSASSPETEPNFYTYHPCLENAHGNNSVTGFNKAEQQANTSSNNGSGGDVTLSATLPYVLSASHPPAVTERNNHAWDLIPSWASASSPVDSPITVEGHQPDSSHFYGHHHDYSTMPLLPNDFPSQSDRVLLDVPEDDLPTSTETQFQQGNLGRSTSLTGEEIASLVSDEVSLARHPSFSEDPQQGEPKSHDGDNNNNNDNDPYCFDPLFLLENDDFFACL